jgi:hypothetical protein
LKRPSIVSVLLALVPFAAMCFSVGLWDRITPRVFGLPFNLFWLMAWMILTPGVLALVYRLERNR